MPHPCAPSTRWFWYTGACWWADSPYTVLPSRACTAHPPFDGLHGGPALPAWAVTREAAHRASSISVKTQFATGSFNYEDLCQLYAVNSQHSSELLRHLVSSTVATHIEWYWSSMVCKDIVLCFMYSNTTTYSTCDVRAPHTPSAQYSLHTSYKRPCSMCGGVD